MRRARIKVFHFTSRHQRHDVVETGPGHFAGTDRFAVFEHRVTVRNEPALFQEMADVDDAHAPGSEPGNRRKELLGVGLRETARWLVHDQHLGRDQQSPRNLDDLLLGDRKIAGQPVQIEPLMAELGERRLRAFPGSLAVDPARPGRFGPQQNIFLRTQVQREIQLLVDHRHALEPGVMGIFRQVRHPAEIHRARVRPVSTAEDLHQGALARAVLPDDRVHFARRDLQRNALQRPGGAKAFLDRREAEADVGHLTSNT